jgi:hypothetical protein
MKERGKGEQQGKKDKRFRRSGADPSEKIRHKEKEMMDGAERGNEGDCEGQRTSAQTAYRHQTWLPGRSRPP